MDAVTVETATHSMALKQSHAMNSFGYNVRNKRLSIGMSIEELARTSTLQLAYIEAVEKGKTTPTLFSALKIADALGCKLHELIKDIFE